MAKIKLPDWQRDFYLRSPILAQLTELLSVSNFENWPDTAQLSKLLSNTICSSYGKTIQFKRPDTQLSMSYEERIYYRGEVETRNSNWHDFFNACIWALFPQTKIILNQRHIEQINIQSGSQRTAYRDTITHLDESGVIVASCNDALIQELQQHHWQSVFHRQKSEWGRTIDAFVFGHGIYEKALNPFIGFTGKMLPVRVKEDFFSLAKSQQYQQLDQHVSSQISENKLLINNHCMSPFPILGVPGWFEQNKDPLFYLNTQYFRPKRQ